MGNVVLKRKKKLSAGRKLALGAWRTAYDPSIYGSFKINMREALRYIQAFREATNKHLTVTHLVIKAIGKALAACPDANGLLRFNNIYLRQSTDVTVLISTEDNQEIDLSATKLTQVDQMSLSSITEKLEQNADKIRKHQDLEIEKTRHSLKYMPNFLMPWVLKTLAFLSYTLNLDLKRFGIARDPFAGAVVTSIGSLGLDVAYVPLVPYSRVPIFVAPGAVQDEPVVENGHVVAGKTMTINATLDHRLVDGIHAQHLVEAFRSILEQPFENLDPLPDSLQSSLASPNNSNDVTRQPSRSL